MPERPSECYWKNFGGERQPREEAVWANRIEGLCERWPQHLHRCLQALATGLAEANGVLKELDPRKMEEKVKAVIAEALRLRRTEAMESAPYAAWQWRQ